MKTTEYLRMCTALPERVQRLTESVYEQLAIWDTVKREVHGLWMWVDKREREPTPCSIVIVGTSDDGRPIVMGDRLFVPHQITDRVTQSPYSESATKSFTADYEMQPRAVIFLVASPEVHIVDVLIGNVAQTASVGAVPFVVTRDALRIGSVLRVTVRHQKSP